MIIKLRTGIAGNYLISRSVISPILQLKHVMDATTDDKNISLRMEFQSRDEIGQLGMQFNRMMDKLNLLIKENNARQQQFAREYEVKLLQAQINPHFLYNTLEMIIMLTGMSKQKIEGMLGESALATHLQSFGIVSVNTKLKLTYVSLGLIIPAQVTIIPLYVLLNQLRIKNSHLGLILPYSAFALGLCILMLYAFFVPCPRNWRRRLLLTAVVFTAAFSPLFCQLSALRWQLGLF